MYPLRWLRKNCIRPLRKSENIISARLGSHITHPGAYVKIVKTFITPMGNLCTPHEQNRFGCMRWSNISECACIILYGMMSLIDIIRDVRSLQDFYHVAHHACERYQASVWLTFCWVLFPSRWPLLQYEGLSQGGQRRSASCGYGKDAHHRY